MILALALAACEHAGTVPLVGADSGASDSATGGDDEPLVCEGLAHPFPLGNIPDIRAAMGYRPDPIWNFMGRASAIRLSGDQTCPMASIEGNTTTLSGECTTNEITMTGSYQETRGESDYVWILDKLMWTSTDGRQFGGDGEAAFQGGGTYAWQIDAAVHDVGFVSNDDGPIDADYVWQGTREQDAAENVLEAARVDVTALNGSYAGDFCYEEVWDPSLCEGDGGATLRVTGDHDVTLRIGGAAPCDGKVHVFIDGTEAGTY